MQDKTFTELLNNLKDVRIQKLKKVEDEFFESRKNLIISLAKKKNRYKVGDNIKDAEGEVFITQIAYTLKKNEPTCIFTGICTKKLGKKKRQMITRKIWLDDVI